MNIHTNFGIGTVKIEGKYQIELSDAKTGELQKTVRKKNVISDSAHWMNFCQQLGIRGSSGIGAMIDSYSSGTRGTVRYQSGYGLFNGLYLTDNTDYVPNSSTGFRRGNLVGRVEGVSADSNLTRGIFNQNLSVITPEYVKLVYDFTADKGNGKIGSIFIGTYHSSYGIYASRYPAQNYIQYERFPNPNICGELDLTANKMYYLEYNTTNTLVTIDLATLEFSRRTLPISPYTSYNNHLFKEGDFLYCLSYSGNQSTIYKLNINSAPISVVASANLPVTGAFQSLFSDGKYVFAIGSNTQTIYKYSLLDLTLVDTITVSSTVNLGTSNYTEYFYDKQIGKVITPSGGAESTTGIMYQVDLSDFLTSGNNKFVPLFTEFTSVNSSYVRRVKMLPDGSFYGIGQYSYSYPLYKFYKGQGTVGSSLLLDTPITKNETQTMRIVYTINFMNTLL